MKILVACEESQRVCIVFREKGHEAYSCDILPCSGGHPEWHIQGNVLEQLNKDWDMIIAFPPCTHLAVSGAAHFAKKRADGRQQEGIDFFMKFADLKCEKVAIENPVGIMSSIWRKPDQIIHPWQFGHDTTKRTCLWLKGFPKLQPTKIVEPKYKICADGKKYPLWHIHTGKGKSVERSKTFSGIAKAMADQWG